MARHAKCQTCYRRQPVRKDGTLFKHDRAQATCDGSGKAVTR
jgi:hypothetical protein